VSEFLVVRLPEATADASWVVLDSAGHRVSQPESGPLKSAAEAADNRRVILLADGLNVITTTANVPVKGQSRLLKMLPYSLEDVVTEEVDRFFFCPGARSENGTTAVSIIEREKLDRWLTDCEEAGLVPNLVYADTDGVPDTPGNLTLVVEGDRVYGRMPNQPPFVLEGFRLAEVLQIVAPDEDDASSSLHVVVFADESGYAHCEAEIDSLRLQVASLDVHMLPEGPLPRFGATLINQPGSNLLQGPYAPKSNWRGLVRPWRLAAALLVGLAALATATEGVRYFSLSRQDQALTAQLQSGCQNAFQTAQLTACRGEIQRRLAAVGAGDAATAGPLFLTALAAVAEAGAESGRFEALSFRNGVTDVRMVVSDVATLDGLARAIESGGRFDVNIQSATPGSDGVEGRLQVVEATQ
jgi:general secretion pathway protein L